MYALHNSKIVKLSAYTFNVSETSADKPGSSKVSSPGKCLTRGVTYQPSLMEDEGEVFGVPEDDEKDEDEEDEEESDGEFEPTKRPRQNKFSTGIYDEDNDDDEDDEAEDDDEDVEAPPVEGIYDPREFDHLTVDTEISDLFGYIVKYRAQTIILDYKLKPFIPDYIPAVGDIDAFLKVGRPDREEDGLGLSVVDEPLAGQSDPAVLELTLVMWYHL